MGIIESIMNTTDTQRAALQQLQAYKQLIDDDIATYSDELLNTWGVQYGEASQVILSSYTRVLARGGKRLRGALVMNSYRMYGGTDEALALRLARAIEMIHAYVLILDDIQDESDIRRGGSTAHRLVEQYHGQQNMRGDAEHFGVAQAMNTMVIGAHLAQQMIGQLPTQDDIKIRLLNHLNDNLIATASGQIGDLLNVELQNVAEADVLNVLTTKTAYYSFWNPIAMGALLAGAEPKEFAPLKEYSLKVGLGFQLRDDILGTFGNSFDSGKSASDDLREGKVTLLVARALAVSSAEQSATLLRVLGNHSASESDFERARTILKSTGALHYVSQRADEYVGEAVAALDESLGSDDSESVEFLRGLAMYVASRNQ